MKFDMSVNDIVNHRRYPELIARFHASYVRVESGCLEWTAAHYPNGGRPRFTVLTKHYMAARVAWVFLRGPIPEGLLVLHKCDNPECVDIEHLFLGTHADNVADMIAKRRDARGEAKANAKLTDEDVSAIRAEYVSGRRRSFTAMADEYGVSRQHLIRVARELHWKIPSYRKR